MVEPTRTAQQEALKQEFHRLYAVLIAAMNGIGRAVAGDQELSDLRRDLMKARAACEAAGVKVETVWEFAERARAESELQVRALAQQQRTVVPMFPRRLRNRVASLGGLAAFGAVLLHWPTAGGVLGAIVAGAVAWALVQEYISRYFPTPGIRVGRLAAQLEVGHLDIWSAQEGDAKDFRVGYRQYQLRHRTGGSGWIKVR